MAMGKEIGMAALEVARLLSERGLAEGDEGLPVWLEPSWNELVLARSVPRGFVRV